MDSLSFEWTANRYKDLRDCEDCYLYAVTYRTQLLYIGKAYNQTVQAWLSHISHLREKYGNIINHITVWLGEISYQSFSNISPDRITDAECLMIYMNQPRDNVPCTKNYTGRPNLRIRSKGCPFLYDEVWVQEGMCYPASLRP